MTLSEKNNLPLKVLKNWRVLFVSGLNYFSLNRISTYAKVTFIGQINSLSKTSLTISGAWGRIVILPHCKYGFQIYLMLGIPITSTVLRLTYLFILYNSITSDCLLNNIFYPSKLSTRLYYTTGGGSFIFLSWEEFKNSF